MPFSMRLVLPENLSQIEGLEPGAVYEDELHDVASLIDDLCETLQDVPGLRFDVTGFGDSRWRVDIETDLAVVLRQLEDVIKGIERSVSDFSLNFYEQGMERYLELAVEDQWLRIVCRSGTDWKPNPDTERMLANEALEMLRRLAVDFTSVASAACPEAVQHPWYQSWVKSISD